MTCGASRIRRVRQSHQVPHEGKGQVGMAKKKSITKTDWQKRISASPKICHEKPCIKGTRIMVSIILE